MATEAPQEASSVSLQQQQRHPSSINTTRTTTTTTATAESMAHRPLDFDDEDVRLDIQSITDIRSYTDQAKRQRQVLRASRSTFESISVFSCPAVTEDQQQQQQQRRLWCSKEAKELMEALSDALPWVTTLRLHNLGCIPSTLLLPFFRRESSLQLVSLHNVYVDTEKQVQRVGYKSATPFMSEGRRSHLELVLDQTTDIIGLAALLECQNLIFRDFFESLALVSSSLPLVSSSSPSSRHATESSPVTTTIKNDEDDEDNHNWQVLWTAIDALELRTIHLKRFSSLTMTFLQRLFQSLTLSGAMQLLVIQKSYFVHDTSTNINHQDESKKNDKECMTNFIESLNQSILQYCRQSSFQEEPFRLILGNCQADEGFFANSLLPSLSQELDDLETLEVDSSYPREDHDFLDLCLTCYKQHQNNQKNDTNDQWSAVKKLAFCYPSWTIQDRLAFTSSAFSANPSLKRLCWVIPYVDVLFSDLSTLLQQSNESRNQFQELILQVTTHPGLPSTESLLELMEILLSTPCHISTFQLIPMWEKQSSSITLLFHHSSFNVRTALERLLETNYNIDRMVVFGQDSSSKQHTATTTTTTTSATTQSSTSKQNEKHFFFSETSNFFLRLNQNKGRRFLQKGIERVDKGEWVEALISSRNDLSQLFYFCRLNPSLLLDVHLDEEMKDDDASVGRRCWCCRFP